MQKVPSTLAELVAPLSEEAFLALLRERKLTLLRGAGADRYAALMDWRTLLRMIREGRHPADLSEFHLVKDSMLAPPDRWLKPNPSGAGNVVDLPNFLAYMAGGFSLAMTRVDAYAPHLSLLCDSVRATVREQIKVGVIVTTGQGGAFTLHYDPEDLIILQVEGRKRWKVFGPPVVNPVPGIKPPPPPEDTLLFDEILEPGDFLFLPAGNWHRCENQSSRSLHLGIFFQPPNGADVLRSLTSRLLSDARFRAPLTRLDSGADLSAIEADIKNRFIEQIGKLSLNDFFSDFEKQP
ncbi:MAG TPA: cupin domain-containing protein [Rhizomicrobium sp.]|nr:cupin domain-containing protein [Rhizomicrobium sp.]